MREREFTTEKTGHICLVLQAWDIVSYPLKKELKIILARGIGPPIFAIVNTHTTANTTGAGTTAAHDYKTKYSDLLAKHFEREAFLEDLAAFVSDFGNDMTVPTEKRLSMIRQTIAHDVAGILSEDPCFLPRCSGWRNAGK